MTVPLLDFCDLTQTLADQNPTHWKMESTCVWKCGKILGSGHLVRFKIKGF